MVLKPHALRRTAANRIDVASRLSVRTTAACRLFPSGEALPSTTSAGSYLPLFDRFHGTTTSSDFSSAYMLGVRLLPSRAGPARLRARVRPPRFRAALIKADDVDRILANIDAHRGNGRD